MLSTIIFDLDMTLLDSMVATTYGANLLAEKFGLPKRTYDHVLSGASLPTREFWTNLWGMYNEEWDDFMKSRVIPEICRQTKLFPEAEDILISAKNKGILLAVASNRNNPWNDLIELDLAKFFDTVVGSSDVPRPKPDPVMLQTILGQLGVERQAALYIGDTTTDMICAKAANIKALGLTQSGATSTDLYRAGATFVRSSMAESRDILGC
jgi:phosphoglycolate phosphatase